MHYDVTVVLRYTPVVDDQLLLVTRLCEQFFCTKSTFLTVSVIRKLAIIKKKKYLIRAHCVRHVHYVMQRMSRDRLLHSITADSLLAPHQVSAASEMDPTYVTARQVLSNEPVRGFKHYVTT